MNHLSQEKIAHVIYKIISPNHHFGKIIEIRNKDYFLLTDKM